MQRPCDECGENKVDTCKQCLNTMLCEKQECIDKHNAIYCSLKKSTGCTKVKCNGNHFKKLCETSDPRVYAHLMDLFMITPKTNLPIYKDLVYMIFPGPIKGPIPHSLRVIKNDPNGNDFMTSIKPTNAKKWYYAIRLEDTTRMLVKQLNDEQRSQLFELIGKKKNPMQFK
jgi:hypothetical protein